MKAECSLNFSFPGISERMAKDVGWPFLVVRRNNINECQRDTRPKVTSDYECETRRTVDLCASEVHRTVIVFRCLLSVLLSTSVDHSS